MPAALTAVSEKREAREIPGFSFYDLNPAEAPPLGRKKKVCEGAGRLPVLCRALQPPGMYTALGFIFPWLPISFRSCRVLGYVKQVRLCSS